MNTSNFKSVSSTKSSPTPSSTLLQFNNVWKIYRMGEVEVPALKGITLKIHAGDFVAIMGSSGSGKSTMMNLIGCLDIPSRGTIFLTSLDISQLDESDLASVRGKTIGFVFQQYNLIPTMSAYDNVLLPLELQEVDEELAAQQTKKILERVGLADKMHHLPTQLSGGQQQRVSIARCLVTNPEIILADEPTGALDSVTGTEILHLFHDLWKNEKKTIILVTHDMHVARYAQTIIELKDGQIINIIKNNPKKEVAS